MVWLAIDNAIFSYVAHILWKIVGFFHGYKWDGVFAPTDIKFFIPYVCAKSIFRIYFSAKLKQFWIVFEYEPPVFKQ